MALARCAGSSRRFTHVFGSFSSSQATSIAPAAEEALRQARRRSPRRTRRSVQTTERAVLMADSPWYLGALRAGRYRGALAPVNR